MMNLIKKQQTLYGLDGYNSTIEKVIKDLEAGNYSFEIKLILTEALSNAFLHGNNSDKSKPIELIYGYDGTCLNFKIVSENVKAENISIPEFIDDSDILDEHGRGLFLIRSMADKVEFEDNSLIISKCIL